MNTQRLALACLVAACLAACKQPAEPVAPAGPAATATVAETPAPTAVESAPSASPADVPFDIKGFAGAFRGTLPCADCPGIDTELVLGNDGTFVLEETYRERTGGASRIEGTWTVETNDRHIRLDPDSKSEDDRLYAIVSHEEIRLLDAQGKAIRSDRPSSLRRDATTK